MVSDTDYVNSKVKDMKKVKGINADINPKTGAARPDWAKAESDARDERYAALAQMRLRKEENRNKIEVYND